MLKPLFFPRFLHVHTNELQKTQHFQLLELETWQVISILVQAYSLLGPLWLYFIWESSVSTPEHWV